MLSVGTCHPATASTFPTQTASSACVFPVPRVCVASSSPISPLCRQFLLDRVAAMGEFEQAQHLGRLVAALLAGEGNARRLAAGVELDLDRLNNATNTVLEADHERIHLVDDRLPVFEKLTGSLLGTRHQQFLALVQNKDCQFSCSEATCKGLVTRLLRAISPRQCCNAG
jgi:hypothetical protein